MVRTIDKMPTTKHKYIHTQNNPSSIMFTSVTSVYYASLLVVLLVSWSSRSHSGCQAFSFSTSSKVSSTSSTTTTTTQLYASTDLKTLPGSTAPFKNGFDPLRLSTVGSESTLAWFQAAYVILVLVGVVSCFVCVLVWLAFARDVCVGVTKMMKIYKISLFVRLGVDINTR